MAFFFAVLSTFGLTRSIHKEDGLLVLTEKNFDKAMKKHPNGLLVEFYLEEHTPELIKVADALDKQDPPRSVAKVEVDENPKLKIRFNI